VTPLCIEAARAEGLAVVESFLDERAECRLGLDGWQGPEIALQLPAGPLADLCGNALSLPAPSLVALRRTGPSLR
jgi:hypothetical protein